MSTIEPDTRDWTWVLERPCDECAFDAASLDLARLPAAIRDNATVWQVALGDDDAGVRPSPHIWSPLEYACHVRDVNRLFGARVSAMLADENPEFVNWDQDAAAIQGDYLSQSPEVVASEVVAAADRVASLYASVANSQWQRSGRRSNGSTFSVDSLARYHLHDLVHHAHDISYLTKRITVASYDESASAWLETESEPETAVLDYLARFEARCGPDARVLEIGSGSGRDAQVLEEAGVSVRRTDISAGFVRALREQGLPADRLDPLIDDLADPERPEPYDGFFASASLLHVRREDLLRVLQRLHDAVGPGGVGFVTVKEGDGARFSTHGRIAQPRHFTFWRADELTRVFEQAGWQVDAVRRSLSSLGQSWLQVDCRRPAAEPTGGAGHASH